MNKILCSTIIAYTLLQACAVSYAQSDRRNNSVYPKSVITHAEDAIDALNAGDYRIVRVNLKALITEAESELRHDRRPPAAPHPSDICTLNNDSHTIIYQDPFIQKEKRLLGYVENGSQIENLYETRIDHSSRTPIILIKVRLIFARTRNAKDAAEGSIGWMMKPHTCFK
jgi:hypothetical protein